MRYRFLGQPDKRFPELKHMGIYALKVRTANFIVGWIFGYKIEIYKPFYCPYSNWKSFYLNWRPMTMEIVRLENDALDKRKKANHN